MIAAIAMVVTAADAQAAAVSGRFEQLDLAVGAAGAIVGNYRDVQGEGVTKTCAFTIAGTVDARGRGTIMASDGRGPARAGRIDARADKVTLAVAGARDFAGCGLVLMPEIDSGIDLTKTGGADWTSLARVAEPRVALHLAPASPAVHGYVVRGDVVGVSARRGGWVHVEFRSDAGRASSGWVGASAVAALSPRG